MQLYQRHQSSVFRFALSMGVGEQAAADVTQDVFITLLENAGRLNPKLGSCRAWLLGMARNLVLRVLERTRRQPLNVDAADLETNEAVSDPLSRPVVRTELEDVREAVSGLAHAHREVVVLSDLLGFSYEETAEILGCPIGTVRSRLHRAHVRLGELLDVPPARREVS